jgi:hypothetical protein
VEGKRKSMSEGVREVGETRRTQQISTLQKADLSTERNEKSKA